MPAGVESYPPFLHGWTGILEQGILVDLQELGEPHARRLLDDLKRRLSGINNVNAYVRAIMNNTKRPLPQQAHEVASAAGTAVKRPRLEARSAAMGGGFSATPLQQEPGLPCSAQPSGPVLRAPGRALHDALVAPCGDQQGLARDVAAPRAVTTLCSDPATTVEDRRTYYRDFLKKYAREKHGQFHDSIPSDEELSRMVYSIEIRLSGKEGFARTLREPYPNQKGKRMYRKFGSDRFLTVQLPNNGLQYWHLESFELCGRKFNFLIPKRTMASAKQLEKTEGSNAQYGYVIAYFFAESGPGLAPISVEDVREWHFPLRHVPKDMSLSKYAERFKLAFSDTDRTIQLRPDQVAVRDDYVSSTSTKEVLTDGNGMISARLMADVARELGTPGRRISAIQVRIGPAKGMLVCANMLPGCMVVLHKSQVKFGESDFFQQCEPLLREIEVCAAIYGDEEHRHPQKLNSQLVLVLQALGCPGQVFLDLEGEHRKKIKETVLSNALFESSLLPSPDVALGDSEKQLCAKIWELHAAGLNHHEDAYFFRLIRHYAASCVQGARQDGHLSCPQSFCLTMVSDFSQRLNPGTMSAWIPGQGFLIGKHLVTRIPCAHPADAVLLEGVDDFFESPGFAYENLAVMSAHGSLACSPASQMSGGDYDGDTCVIIGYRPIVHSVRTVERSTGKDSGYGEKRGKTIRAVMMEPSSPSRRAACGSAPFSAQNKLGDALRESCMEMQTESMSVSKLNNAWTRSADWDISEAHNPTRTLNMVPGSSGCFSSFTLRLAMAQEQALDAAKSGWRMQDPDFKKLESSLARRPQPRWRERSGHVPARQSYSAMGLLHDLPDAREWAEEELPGPRDCDPKLKDFAKARVAQLSKPLREAYRDIFDTVLHQYRQDLKSLKGSRPHIQTYAQAEEAARKSILDQLRGSAEDFALTIFSQQQGNEESWELCRSDLCHVYAKYISGNDTLSIARRGHLGLHTAKKGASDLLCPVHVPQERTHVFQVAKNLQQFARDSGDPDGGELADVERGPAFEIDVEDIHWTHQDPSSRFSDGSPVADLVPKLLAGEVSPQADFLVLDVVPMDGKLYSIRNRRLVALRMYQDELRKQGFDEPVKIKVRKLATDCSRVLLKFLSAYNTESGGRTCEVRDR